LPGKDDIIFLTEGEWDGMIGGKKLAWPGYTFYCWTGGVTSPLKWGHIPDWLRGRRVIFCPDNDTWQGLDVEHYFAPDEKKLREAFVRRKKALETCHVMDRMGCRVQLAQVPIKPEEKWGGDLRDWYEAGGRSLNELLLTDYDDIKKQRPHAESVTLSEAMTRPGKQVKYEAAMLSADFEPKWIPDYTTVTCDMGQHAFCDKCRIPKEFPEGVIHHDENRDLQAQCIIARDPERAMEEKVLGIPRSCNFHRLDPSDEGHLGGVWLAKGFAEKSEVDECLVLSTTMPDVSGGVEVEGKMLHSFSRSQVFCRADEVHVAQAEPVDLQPFMVDLMGECPWDTEDPDRITAYMERRTNDLTANVTRVFGQSRVQMAFDLLMHSALWMTVEDRKRRAWLDVCVMGVTRSGKSEITRQLNTHYGELGRVVSTQDNFSLAGLVAGNVRGRDGNYRVKPGLLPINNRRALVLDEFHTMRGERERSLLESLQECRDVGFVQTVKVAGNLRLPAAVRLLTVANPPADFSLYRYQCEMLLDLYVSPESLARLDFGVIITEEMHEKALQLKPFTSKEFWHPDISNALVKRAWELEPEQVMFGEGVMDLSHRVLKEWSSVLTTELPLFTGPEKRLSLLRVAIAIANLTFSHPKGEPMVCMVRRAHVTWAREWFELMWNESGYGDLCAGSPKRKLVSKPLLVEWLFVKHFPEADDAATALTHFFKRLARAEIQSLLGIEIRDVDKWTRDVLANNALDLSRQKGHFTAFQPTDGGVRILRRIVEMAETDPEEYVSRRIKLDYWMGNQGNGLPLGSEPELEPLTEEVECPF
jgi:hypothetical protein